MNQYIIHEATQNDLAELELLEQEVWQDLSVPLMRKQELQTWLNNNSPFFLVAKQNEQLAGYYYGQVNDFSLINTDEFIHKISGTGNTLHAHQPEGNSVYLVSIVSRKPGAGKALQHEALTRARQFNKHFCFCYSRLSGFADYLSSLPAEILAQIHSYSEQSVALWYAHECIKLVNGKIWDACIPQPKLSLPLPTKPDPVLTFHIKNTHSGLLNIVKDYMPDPQSKNYAALIAYQT